MSEDRPAVFVIDDDPSMRRSLDTLLRSVALDVHIFSSTQEFMHAKRPTHRVASCCRCGCPATDPDSLAFMYNFCVNTPAAVLNNVIVNAAGYAPFNTTSGRLLRARHCRHGARGCERRRESGQRSPVVRHALPAAGHRPQLQYGHQLLRSQGARCRCDRRLAAHRRDAPEVDLGLSRARLVERRRCRRRADRMCG